MTTSKEAIKRLTGWRPCKYKSCNVHLYRDDIMNYFVDDFNYKKVSPGALLQFQKTESLSGIPSVIIFGEFLIPPNAFLELDQGFSVLRPQLIHTKESANECNNVWSFEVPNSLSTSASLTAKVNNYGKVKLHADIGRMIV